MNLPDYEIDVTVAVRPERTVTVNDAAVQLSALNEQISRHTAGRSACIHVHVYAPGSPDPEYLAYVRRVQDELRKAHYAMLHFQTRFE